MEDTIYRGWETQGWQRLAGNLRAAAPGALAPQTAPMGLGGQILTQKVA
jgi:hypothetical protein